MKADIPFKSLANEFNSDGFKFGRCYVIVKGKIEEVFYYTTTDGNYYYGVILQKEYNNFNVSYSSPTAYALDQQRVIGIVTNEIKKEFPYRYSCSEFSFRTEYGDGLFLTEENAKIFLDNKNEMDKINKKYETPMKYEIKSSFN